MSIFLNILNEHLDRAIKWLHIRVPDYIVIKVGNEEKGREHKQKHEKRIRDCKRPRRILRTSVFHHLKRKAKKKSKRKKHRHHETATSL
jgi:hypothetical protein